MLPTHLATLENAQLIHLAQAMPEVEYLFRHALVQDAAYSSLLKTDRKAIHRRVAETLEHLDPVPYATLAQHYAEAEVFDRARDYYQRAGEAALKAYANYEAERLFNAALALNPTLAQRAALTTQAGEALFNQNHYSQAIAVWESALPLWNTLGHPDNRARLHARIARAIWHLSDVRGSLMRAIAGLADLTGTPETAGLAVLLHEIGRAHMLNGHPDEAYQFCQRSLALAEQFNNVETQAETLTTLGVIRGMDSATRLRYLQQAVTIAEAHKLDYTASRAHNNIGEVYYVRQVDLPRARDHYQRAGDIAAHRGAVVGSEFCYNNATTVSIFLGDLSAAAKQLETAPPLTVDNQVTLQRAFNRLMLRYYRGETSTIIPELNALRERGRALGLIEFLHEAATLLLEITYRTQGAFPAEVLTEALVNGDIYLSYVIAARAWHCAFLLRAGRVEEAAAVLAEIETHADAERQLAEAHHLALAYARLAAARGELANAASCFERAAALYAERGMRWYQAQTLSEWAHYAEAPLRQRLKQNAHQLLEEMDMKVEF